MLIYRHAPSDLVAALVEGLEGVTIQTTEIDGRSIALTLKAAEHDLDPTAGTITNADGAFSVQLTRQPTPSRFPSYGLPFAHVDRWRCPVTVRLSYGIDGTIPGLLMQAKPQIEEQLVNAIRTVLQPAGGPGWAFEWGGVGTAQHATRQYQVVSVNFIAEVIW